MLSPWLESSVIEQTQLILNSYQHWMGETLIDRLADAAEEANLLFFAPFPVLSHGCQSDPILNYGNRSTLDLWETDWDELTQTPSRLTAEPTIQAERERFLRQVTENGYIDDYSGVRISRRGRRFYIENAVVWNLIDEAGAYCGQAATFREYRFI
jgi:MEKHLA domain